MVGFGLNVLASCIALLLWKAGFIFAAQTGDDTRSTSQDRRTLYFPEGKPFVLPCRNETDGDFVSVYWQSTAYTKTTQTIAVYKYEIDDKTYTSPSFENRIQPVNGTSIRILDARLTDSGNWQCDLIYRELVKKTLKVSIRARYDVHIINSPNELDIQPQNSVMGNIGETASVFCESNSKSPFQITWHKKVGNFTKNVVRRIESEEDADRLRTIRVHLDFKNLSEKDTGDYYCVAKNMGGEQRKTVTVRIKRKPKIVNTMSDVRIDVYKSGKMTCRAKGYPKIDFVWNIRGKYDLSPRQVLDHMSVSQTVYSSTREEGYSELRIKVAEKEYLGTYTCIARNIAGQNVHSILLEGLAPPDPPTILKHMTKAELHRVTLIWKMDEEEGAPTTLVTIEHRNSSSKVDGWTRYAINKAIHRHTVSSLTSGTMYDFRIQVKNSIGASKYSKIAQIETKTEDVAYDTDASSERVLGELNLTALIGIFGGAFIALLVGFVCVCIFVRKMQKSDHDEPQHHSVGTASYAPTTTLPQHTIDGRPAFEMEPLIQHYLVDESEFPRDRLTVTTVLGAGAFGVVMRGLAQGIKGSVGQITVAVKSVRDNTNEAATKDLIAELNLLKLLPEHPNVIGLLGCCTRTEPIYVIVEYCANGDLQGFLRSSRGINEMYYKTSYGGAIPNLTSKMLLTFAWQISKGMQHLSSMKVIHRDLAARNILVDDQLVCKVSDFGFARDIYVEDHYLKRSAGGRFPIKWMAIESLLDGISTTKSDVWSYGVVLWELVTLGASPYPGMNSYEVVSFLQDGYRMDKPKHCSNEIFQVMMDCWNAAPGRRPSFINLADRFRNLIDECADKEFIDMNFYPDHLYVNFDGNNSQSASTATTPHGTLTRNHVTNMQNHHGSNGHVPSSPRNAIRSPSGHTLRPGRTNSVTALSERSVTGASSCSHNTERSGLLVNNDNKQGTLDKALLLRANSQGGPS